MQEMPIPLDLYYDIKFVDNGGENTRRFLLIIGEFPTQTRRGMRMAYGYTIHEMVGYRWDAGKSSSSRYEGGSLAYARGMMHINEIIMGGRIGSVIEQEAPNAGRNHFPGSQPGD